MATWKLHACLVKASAKLQLALNKNRLKKGSLPMMGKPPLIAASQRRDAVGSEF
jgi:hypothetical protein